MRFCRSMFPGRRLPCLLPVFLSILAAQAQVSPALFDGLRWRLIGPFRGGRVIAVSGVPGDGNTFFFGSVGGGLWKTADAGTTWRPIFDGQRIASIGAIAVAPSNPTVIYAGTGESDLRSDISFGDGVYKSTDGGDTWYPVGLRDSRHIGRILVHPGNPEILWVAALGHAYGPNDERGVFRSVNGGRSWEKVLYQGSDLGAVDLALVPENPDILYAALWRARRSAWSQYAPIQGPGSALYRSADGGKSWTLISGRGLPDGEWGRPGVAVAPNTGGKRVFVLVEAVDGGLFRSDDGGENWTRTSNDPRIVSRSWYFGRITVDPGNPDTIYLPNIALYKSVDGGKSFSVLRGAPGGDDYHFLWIDPANSARMICGSDQGATISLNGGRTWTSWYNQPTGQFYHVITDNQFPYYVYGSQQDSGTAAVPNRSDRGRITDSDMISVGGGESGYIAPDPRDPDLVYVSSVYGELSRFDKRTSQSQDITPWPRPGFGAEISLRRYRFPWTPVLVFSKLEPDTLYYGSQYLLRTADGGLHWQEISPDLTGDARIDKTEKPGDPTTTANAKARGYGVIYTIAPSPIEKGQIWVGSDTGLIHLTRDGGKTWSEVTPPGITDWSKITHIEASHSDPAVAYSAIDRHRLDDFKPYLLRTGDFGKTWKLITAGLKEPAFLNAIREDPLRRGLLFAATELGVSFSPDDGDHWQSLQLNLPVTSVRDLVIHGRDLVIATHGRGFWILDDIGPLRQATEKIADSEAWLFEPSEALRAFADPFLGTPLPPEIPQAENPPSGAVIDYYLKSSPRDPVVLEILNEKDEVIRRFSSSAAPGPARNKPVPIADIWLTRPPPLTASAGMNRFIWDLREGSLEQIVEAEAEYGRRMSGVRVLPGSYRVRLQASGRTLVQPLKIVQDPRSKATREELTSQYEWTRKIAAARLRASALMQEIAGFERRLPEKAGQPGTPGGNP